MNETGSFWTYLPYLLGGIPVTLELTLLSMALAVPVSVLLALARSANSRALSWPAGFIVEFFRGSSALVQLFWAYYVLPFFGITLPPIAAGMMVLGLNEGSYFSEVVRAGLNAVPAGQRDAATALHLPPGYRFFRVILPQALPIMIPPFGNALVTMLKFTALASLVSIHEISFRASMIRSNTGQSTPAYGTSLIVYFLLALAFGGLVKLLERVVNRRAGRETPPLFSFTSESSIPSWAVGGGK